MIDSLRGLLPPDIFVNVVDVGANPIDGDPPYKPLLDAGVARVVGFEPNAEALEVLKRQKGPREIYLPDALGDGLEHDLHVTFMPGMVSVLKPNAELLGYFHGFSKWGEVLRVERVKTRRLDDVAEVEDADMLKLDVQGAELSILQHGTRKLADAVLLQIETNFLPMYVGQPLFSEVEIFLRQQGFYFHRFATFISRMIQPLMINNNAYSGMSQALWADSVFVRDFTQLKALSPRKLLKLALLLHDIYRSFDLVVRVLVEHDRLTGLEPAAGLTARYLAALGVKSGAINI